MDLEQRLKDARDASVARAERSVRFGVAEREKYLAELRSGKRRYAAARAVGVTGQHIGRVRKLDPVFDEACLEAEREGIEPVEDVLVEKALDGEPWAVQMVLKNRDRERWGDRKELDVRVSGGVVVEVEAGERLSRIAQLEERLLERAALGGVKAGELVAAVGLDADVVDAELVE